jgi:hypothetical protein
MWHIGLLENTVKIDKKIARELFEKCKDIGWSRLEYVTNGEYLYFNEDHCEHMDYMQSDVNLITILKNHKVKGRIAFGSVEGDNSGCFWGYQFDGKGGCQSVNGSLQWSPEENL